MSSAKKENEETCPIQVVVRSRPINDRERSEHGAPILSFPSLKEITVAPKQSKTTKTYSFDSVYNPEVTQSQLFATTVVPIVNEVLKGFNCTIFAYGQTGTGKTHTMEGGIKGSEAVATNGILPEDAGIIPRAVQQIFQSLEKVLDYSVRVSFLEIYNEELNDLLAVNGSDLSSLRIFEKDDFGKKGVNITGLEEISVNNPSDIFRILERGLKHRQVAETMLNKSSSRSHSIFSITISTKESAPGGEELMKIGKLNLVDLAGSENIGRSGAKDQRKREAGAINQSLLILGRVITALVEKHPYVPYRDSKLTRLLRDSLGGRTKTCIIATVSPSSCSLEETMSTLDYASRAKNIRNRPEVNQRMNKKTLIKDYEVSIAKLQKEITTMRSGVGGFYVQSDTYDEMEKEISANRMRIEEIESQIKSLEDEKKRVEDLFSEKEIELKSVRENLAETEENLQETTVKLEGTISQLEETNLKVEEREKQILVHKKVELKLYGDAQVISSNLKDAMSDVDGLYRKVDRKANVEDENKRKMGQYQQYFVGKTQDIESQSHSFKQNQSNSFSNIDSNLSDFLRNKNEEIENLRGQTERLWRILSESRETLCLLAASHLENSDSLVAKLETNQKNSHENLVKSASNFFEESTRVLNGINQHLESQSQSISEWASRQESQVDSHLESSKSFVSNQRETLSKLNQVNRENEASQLKRQEESRRILNDLADTQKKETAAFEAELLRQFSTMIQQHNRQQEDRLERVFSAVHSSIDSNSQDLKAATLTIEKESEELSRCNESFVELRREESEESKRMIRESSSQLKSHNSSASETTLSCQSLVSRFHSELLESQTKSLNLVVEQSESIRKESVTFSSLNNDRILEQSTLESTFSSEIERKLQDFDEKFEERMENNRRELEIMKETSDSFSSSCIQTASELRTEFGQFLNGIKEDQKTGTTPIKKNRSFPLLPSDSSPNSSLQTYIKSIQLDPTHIVPLVLDSDSLEEGVVSEVVVASVVEVPNVTKTTVVEIAIPKKSKGLAPPTTGKFATGKVQANKENTVNGINSVRS